jgi:hypothetical protein
MTVTNAPPSGTREDAQAPTHSPHEHAEAGKEQATEQRESLADVADAVAESLKEHQQEGLAGYARGMSDGLSSLASHLQRRSIDDLVHDARKLARNNPSMFLLGSIAVGFGLARFLKASEPSSLGDDRQPQMNRQAGEPSKVDPSNRDVHDTQRSGTSEVDDSDEACARSSSEPAAGAAIEGAPSVVATTTVHTTQYKDSDRHE